MLTASFSFDLACCWVTWYSVVGVCLSSYECFKDMVEALIWQPMENIDIYPRISTNVNIGGGDEMICECSVLRSTKS